MKEIEMVRHASRRCERYFTQLTVIAKVVDTGMNHSMMAYHVLFNWSCIRAQIANEVPLRVSLVHMRTI